MIVFCLVRNGWLIQKRLGPPISGSDEALNRFFVERIPDNQKTILVKGLPLRGFEFYEVQLLVSSAIPVTLFHNLQAVEP